MRPPIVMLKRGPFADTPLEEVPDWVLYELANQDRLPRHLAAAVEAESERRAMARRAMRKAA